MNCKDSKNWRNYLGQGSVVIACHNLEDKTLDLDTKWLSRCETEQFSLEFICCT